MSNKDLYEVVKKEHPKYFKSAQSLQVFRSNYGIPLISERSEKLPSSYNNEVTKIELLREFVKGKDFKNMKSKQIQREYEKTYNLKVRGKYFISMLQKLGIDYKKSVGRGKNSSTEVMRQLLIDLDTEDMTAKQIHLYLEQKLGQRVPDSTLYTTLRNMGKKYIPVAHRNFKEETGSNIEDLPKEPLEEVEPLEESKPKVDKHRIQSLKNNTEFVEHMNMLCNSRCFEDILKILNNENCKLNISITAEELKEFLEFTGMKPLKKKQEFDTDTIQVGKTTIPKSVYDEVKLILDVESLNHKCIETLPYTRYELSEWLDMYIKLKQYLGRYLKNAESRFRECELYAEDLRHEIEMSNPEDGGAKMCALMNIRRDMEFDKKMLGTLRTLINNKDITEVALKSYKDNLDRQVYLRDYAYYKPEVDKTLIDKYDWCTDNVQEEPLVYKQPEAKVLTSTAVKDKLTPKQQEQQKYKFKVTYEISGGGRGAFNTGLRSVIAVDEEDAKKSVELSLKSENASYLVTNLKAIKEGVA